MAINLADRWIEARDAVQIKLDDHEEAVEKLGVRLRIAENKIIWFTAAASLLGSLMGGPIKELLGSAVAAARAATIGG